MKNSKLAELNFKTLINYPDINGYSNQKPYKCNGFCIDCEQKGLLATNEKLERMSHGADSDDFKRIITENYKNDTPIMFIMRDPPPSTKPFFTSIEYKGITKEIPTKHYYWIQDYINEPITHDIIMNGSVYDLYFWYLQKHFSLNNIYITNLIKCYSNLYHSKTPNYKIQNNCIERYLLKEIELFNPRIIFCLDSKVHYVMTHNPMRTILKESNVLIEKLKHPALVESYNKNKENYLNENNQIIEKTLAKLNIE